VLETFVGAPQRPQDFSQVVHHDAKDLRLSDQAALPIPESEGFSS